MADSNRAPSAISWSDGWVKPEPVSLGDGSGQFEYEPLWLDSIRLVRILPQSTSTELHCSLEHRRINYGAVVPYTAISYCWGDPGPTKSIKLNGSDFRVSNNLWHALSSISMHHGTSDRYWVDAICIDQTNLEERNRQVYLMWYIFSAASMVLSWVGQPDDDTAEVFATISKVASSCRAPNPERCQGAHDHRQIDLVSSTLKAFANRNYWSRTWILQEFLQAQRIKVVSGQYACFGQDLFHFQEAWSELPAGQLLQSRWTHGVDNDADFYPTTADDVWIIMARTVYDHSRTNCSDSRDRIFAMLSGRVMRKLDAMMSLKPDYTMHNDELALVFFGHCDKVFKDWCNAYRGQRYDVNYADMDPIFRSIANSVSIALRVPCQTKDVIDAFSSGPLRVSKDAHGKALIKLHTGRIMDTTGPLCTYLRETIWFRDEGSEAFRKMQEQFVEKYDKEVFQPRRMQHLNDQSQQPDFQDWLRDKGSLVASGRA